MMSKAFLCSCLIVTIFAANAANILVLFPVPSPSHQILGDELVKALLKKGHHVTMITPYGMKEKFKNYTEVLLEELVEYKEKHFKKVMGFNTSRIDFIRTIIKQDAMSRIVFDNPEIKKLIKSQKTFDVVVLETMMSEALLVFGHIYNAPTVVVNSLGSMHTIDELVGNSHPYAYVPSALAALTDEMTFFERVQNVALSLTMKTLYSVLLLYQQRRVVEDYFPDAPSLDNLMHNVSIVLLNAHFSVVETPRPYMPNMIPIGGFHVQPQTLPDDLKNFLDEAEEGVVLFSLGSNFQSADLPQDKRNAILKSFSKFPQKFLWKFEEEGLGVPENVKVSKWLPQRGVLNHPNVKAFITHGGLLSITEAVYYGVPFIGIPAFADQQYNVANAVHKNFAVKYDMNTISEETFTQAIKEVLHNPIYKENISKRSSLLRGQPIAPLDLAVYWVEHVIKYGGAPHLQSAGIRLNWYKANLLDVIAFLVIIFSIALYVNLIIAKRCLRFACSRLCRKKKVKSA